MNIKIVHKTGCEYLNFGEWVKFHDVVKTINSQGGIFLCRQGKLMQFIPLHQIERIDQTGTE